MPSNPESNGIPAKFPGQCSKCGESFKHYMSAKDGTTRETASRITHDRTPRTDGLTHVYYHVSCKDKPHDPDIIAARLAKKQAKENGAVVPALVADPKPSPANIPTPAANGQSDNFLAAMATALIPYLDGQLKTHASDLTAEMTAMIEKAVASASKVIVIKNEVTGEVKDMGRQHELFPKLMSLVRKRRNVYLFGGPGSGKSTAAQKVADALGLPYGYISLSAQTAESRVIGYMDANRQFSDPVFYRLYKDGGVFCIDEMDNASANLLTALNSALENGHASFPCGMVAKHPDFVLVATGNTAGYGANPAFPERRPMDAAFRERFAFLEWGYDESLERDLALAYNDKASNWIDWVQKVRKYALTQFPRLQVTPRASINGADLLTEFPPSEVADMVLFKGFDADSKARILRDNPLPRFAAN